MRTSLLAAVIIAGAVWLANSTRHSPSIRKHQPTASRHVTPRQTPLTQVAPADVEDPPSEPSRIKFETAPMSQPPLVEVQPKEILQTHPPAGLMKPEPTPITASVEIADSHSSRPDARFYGSPESTNAPIQPVAVQEENTVELFQELAILRRPTFVVQGLTISQEIQYQILSKLQLGSVGSDGKREVSQVILDTRLEKSDPLSRAAFESSLRDLIGQQFAFTLNARHEVIKFTGHKDTRKSIEAKPSGLDGFMMTSVMDEDGWKEMAQLSFFLPDENASSGQWKRQMTHDWGPLGSWFGETTFQRNRQHDQFNYWHNMSYLAPKGDAGGLPFTIKSAKFETQQASGVVQFDAELRRVTSVQEKFQARGDIETQVLGQSSRVLVEEQQLLQIRLFDQNPWQQ